jgi:hypothetical protein
MRFPFVLATLAFLFSSSVVRADGVTVTTSSPGWVQIAPNTFVLPADLTSIGCGLENEPICEPLGEFSLNVLFASSGFVAVLDPEGSPSDVIGFGNFNGHGSIVFASDPLLGVVPSELSNVLCTETDAGCVASFTLKTTNGGTITLTGAFDGEESFDPFGAGFDTSDGLKVTSAGVPEPGSFALLAIGLVGLAGMLRKNLLSR